MDFEKYGFRLNNNLQLLRQRNISHSLRWSNTAIVLKYEMAGDKIEKNFSEREKISFSVFHLIKKIKNYISENFEGNEQMQCKASDCGYNNANFNFIRDDYERTFPKGLFDKKVNTKYYAVDIKSAYLYAALKIGLINKKLFDEANKLEKKDRLVLLGMLAYEPYEIIYQDGKYSEIVRIKNPFKGYFFRLVKEIDDVFYSITQKFKNDVVFFWVDCVFFRGEHNIRLIQNYLKSLGYLSTFWRCFFFEENRNNYGSLGFSIFSYKKYEKKEAQIIKKDYICSYFSSYERKVRAENLRKLLTIFKN